MEPPGSLRQRLQALVPRALETDIESGFLFAIGGVRVARRHLVFLASAIAISTIVTFFLRWATKVDLDAQASFDRGHPVLTMELSNVDDGAIVDVLGQRIIVRDGRARARLRDHAFVPGINEIHATVAGQRFRIAVDVPFVAVADASSMAEPSPRLGIVVRGMPGDAITVDGRTLTVADDGTARASTPARADGSTEEHRFHVVCERDSDSYEQTVVVRAAPSTLVVRRPSWGFTTDRSALTLDADTRPNAVAYLDGREVPVENGRIHTSLLLANEGDFRFRLDVVEPGKKRRSETIFVRRVADLRAAAEGFAPEITLDYPTLAREFAARAGKRVLFRARVSSLWSDRGRSFFEVDAMPCPTSACPMRVEYPSTSTIHAGDTVLVRGTVAGQTDHDGPPRPRLEAEFVTLEAM